MDGLPVQPATYSAVLDSSPLLGSSMPIAESASTGIKPVSLSFTYFPKSESGLNAVKLTERAVFPSDVLTLYYPKGKIFFTGKECQRSLSYGLGDMIFNDQPEHEARLHRAEYPTTQTDCINGWHCHIKVKKENIPNFIEALFLRHGLDSVNSDTHKNQFLRSMTVLKDAPGTTGLKFPDGSYSQNQECKDMTESIPLDDTDFQFVH
ncbi:hypothetical protein [Endozoicomonas sp. SCSIO W0465]|uniref:hypothetical protein n=1 Tax=Endozoicomonas sp. SCSIO W0465 TaxID=2918516 RepID=UPI0020762F4D|nr:hypothetical protein [Endozoicomonas sp. SCSIO W0465]USE37293.1 hypothetical protein MJO57_03440 [Endozoicomonas sp. SCSIO W0465]